MSSSPTSSPSPGLIRALGPWAAAAIVVGTMVGTGIFIVPGAMARDAGAPGLVLLVWVAGGLLTLFGALTYAELGAAVPEAGGEYAYIKRGFSERWAFLYGWMHSIVGRPSTLATIAAGLLRFVSFLAPSVAVPMAALNIPLPFANEPYAFVFTPAQLYAAAAIAVMSLVNYLGVKLGGAIQVALTIVKVAAVMAVVALGFALGGGAPTPGAAAGALSPGASEAALRAVSFGGFLTALVAALWAYDGWTDLTMVGSEIEEPQRNIPRSLVFGVAAVMGLYLLMNAVCFYVLPFERVAASTTVASDVLAMVAGPQTAAWLTVAMIVCALGTLNSSTLSGARVGYAMARDGIFFKVASGIHPRYRTPGGALAFQATAACLLALTGTFEDLYSLVIFAQWIFYGLATASVFTLRRREPDLPRPYRTWGYPVVPALFVLGAIALTANLWLERPLRSTVGLLLILAGLWFYRRWTATRRPGIGEPASPPA